MSPQRFRFHLESVLELRKSRQEQEEKMYLKLVNDLAGMDRQIEEVQQEQRRVFRECEGKMAGNLLLDEWRRDLDYAGYLDQVRARLNHRREEINQERLRRQATMIEATKKRKILDSLKGKHHQEYNHEINRQEQIEIDDWATTGYLRRK